MTLYHIIKISIKSMDGLITRHSHQDPNEYLYSNYYVFGNALYKNMLELYKKFICNNSFGILDDFNDFLDNRLTTLISRIKMNGENNTVIMITGITIMPPRYLEDGENKPMYPIDARMKELTYSAGVYGYITTFDRQDLEDSNKCGHIPTPLDQSYNPIRIMDIPIMTRSKACHLYNMRDSERQLHGEKSNHPGGTFIVKGNEVFIQMYDMCRINTMLIFHRKKNDGPASCSVTHDLVYASIVTNLTMRSVSIDSSLGMYHAPKIEIMMCTNGVSRVTDEEPKSLSGVNVISLLICMSQIYSSTQCLDVDSTVKFIKSRCIPHTLHRVLPILSSTIIHARSISDHKNAVASSIPNISSGKNDLISYIDRNILPLTDGYNNGKVEGLVTMIVQYAEFFAGLRPISDRDSWTNKRLSTPTKIMERKIANVVFKRSRGNNAFTSTRSVSEYLVNDLTNSMVSMLSNNPKGKSTESKSNEIQRFVTYNPVSMKGQISRSSVTINTTPAIPDVRKIKNQSGYVCISYIPQSNMCGINKELALLTKVTHPIPSDCVKVIAKNSGLLVDSSNFSEDVCKLFINETTYGLCYGPQLRDYMISARRSGYIHNHAEIVLDSGILRIHTDAGRLVTPLFIVDKITQELIIERNNLWQDAPNFTNGTIEYIGTCEQDYCRIARQPEDIQTRIDRMNSLQEKINKSTDTDEVQLWNDELKYEIECPYTHMFIHPMQLYGVGASSVPLLNFTQSTKVTGQSNLARQALCQIDSSYRHFAPSNKYRITTTKALVSTVYEREFFQRSGCSAVLCMHTLGGNVVEDAGVINSKSFGMFTHCVVKTHTFYIENNNDGVVDSISRPNISQLSKKKSIDYRFISASGYPYIGAPLTNGDVVLSIIRKSTINGRESVAPNPKIVRFGEDGVVNDIQVFQSKRGRGNMVVKIILVKYLNPAVSDKLTFRCGQKWTVSTFLPPQALPKSINGTTPDIVISPFTAKRVTLSLQNEGILSSIGLLNACLMDGTAWNVNDQDITAAYDYLESIGCSNLMQSTYNGRPVQNPLYFGIAYTQSVKYLAFSLTKCTGRYSGFLDQATKQGVKSKNGGGIKIGAMDNSVISSGYGCQKLLNALTVGSTYDVTIIVCSNCGCIQSTELKPICIRCNSSIKSYGRAVKTSYGVVVIDKYLKSMGMAFRLDCNNRPSRKAIADDDDIEDFDDFDNYPSDEDYDESNINMADVIPEM